MKKNIFIAILLLTSLGVITANFIGKEKSYLKVEKEKTNKIVLPSVFLVITGFSSEQNNISYKKLTEAYCNGELYVLSSNYELFQNYISEWPEIKNKKCKPPIVLESLADFAPIAKNKILLVDLYYMSGLFKALSVDSINFFENPDQYKLVFGGKFNFKNQITKFSMTGVTAITRAAGRTADREGIDYLTKNLKPYFQNSDFVHISNEVSFKDSCEYVAGTTRFCTKEIHFKALKDLNCNIVELTGNHNRDYGDKAYKKTFQWYKENNIKTFGGGLNPEEANTPLIITMKDGKKLGIIGFNEACPLGECSKKEGEVGANFYEKEKARNVIRKIKEELKADYIIASVQFTECDKYEPHSMQLKISHDLIDFGADFVYGSQAHQIQQVEFYKGKPIFHGLGNFLFDQIHRRGVRQAFFLQHYFFDGKLVQTIPVYTFMQDNRQQSIATKQQREEMEKLVLVDSMLYRKY
jgi:poly-gamma-glutamate capsule biosynthesis protein CapA/YwtB (metallophosphatase superfamily)